MSEKLTGHKIPSAVHAENAENLASAWLHQFHPGPAEELVTLHLSLAQGLANYNLWSLFIMPSCCHFVSFFVYQITQVYEHTLCHYIASVFDLALEAFSNRDLITRLSVCECVSPFFTFIISRTNGRGISMKLWNWSQLINSKSTWYWRQWEGHWVRGQRSRSDSDGRKSLRTL